jgi:hypothetical protein
VKGLEDADMEDVVDVRTLWQLEAVSDVADAFLDLERTCILGAQLAAHSRDRGLSRTMQKAEPNPDANVELQVMVMSIVVALGILLRMKEPVTDVVEESIPVL